MDKKAEEWLCVEQNRELFSDIRGRGGASLAPRPMTVAFGLGTRLHACTHVYKIRKWRPTQRTAAGQCWAANSFIDQTE